MSAFSDSIFSFLCLTSFSLRGLHVCLQRLDFLVFVLDLVLLESLVHLGLVHVLLVLLCLHRLGGLRLRLKLLEVRDDHLQKVDDATSSSLVARVGARGSRGVRRWLLVEGG